jgi:hypothetical protein
MTRGIVTDFVLGTEPQLVTMRIYKGRDTVFVPTTKDDTGADIDLDTVTSNLAVVIVEKQGASTVLAQFTISTTVGSMTWSLPRAAIASLANATYWWRFDVEVGGILGPPLMAGPCEVRLP